MSGFCPDCGGDTFSAGCACERATLNKECPVSTLANDPCITEVSIPPRIGECRCGRRWGSHSIAECIAQPPDPCSPSLRAALDEAREDADRIDAALCGCPIDPCPTCSRHIAAHYEETQRRIDAEDRIAQALALAAALETVNSGPRLDQVVTLSTVRGFRAILAPRTTAAQLADGTTDATEAPPAELLKALEARLSRSEARERDLREALKACWWWGMWARFEEWNYYNGPERRSNARVTDRTDEARDRWERARRVIEGER